MITPGSPSSHAKPSYATIYPWKKALQSIPLTLKEEASRILYVPSTCGERIDSFVS
jgi:hypothetical protein